MSHSMPRAARAAACAENFAFEHVRGHQRMLIEIAERVDGGDSKAGAGRGFGGRPGRHAGDEDVRRHLRQVRASRARLPA